MDHKKARAEVVVKLHKLRRRIKEMESGQGGGVDNKKDIEAMRGEVNVLNKELQSIEDAGHTTFMDAKTMLEPKKGVSSKNRRIKWRRMQIEKRIKKLEERQGEPDATDEEREENLAKIAKFKEELAGLDEEKSALKDYNHTRFMEARKSDAQEEKQGAAMEEVEKKITQAEGKLEQACELGNQEDAAELQEDLHLLRMEKESIENFTHDLFLKNLDNLKAKRRSQLK